MSRRILVIDDEEITNQCLRFLLPKRINDVEVETFTLANDALHILQDNTIPKPDVIITDYYRPEDYRSTLDFLEIVRMRPRTKFIKIILYSALDDDKTLHRLRNLVNVHLRKPCGMDELVESINKLFNYIDEERMDIDREEYFDFSI